MIAELKPYEDYTGTEQTWLGEIPSHWELSRLGARLFERRETNENNEIQDVLSVMKGRGVIPYAEKGNVGNKRSDDIRRYKIVRPNDIVINCMNVIIGSLGISKYTGCLSPVYYVLRTRFSDDLPRYFNAVFQSPNFHRSLVRIGNGILAHRMRIPMEKLKCEMIPIPPPDEQELIVRFLDWASVRLGKAIAAKRKVIGLLEEQKQAIIHRAVTRGLDDSVPLKPSGLDWLGDVPEHWEVRPIGTITKYISYGFTNPMPSTDSGPYLLTAADIGEGSIRYDTARHTSEFAFCNLITNKSRPRKNDILITKDGTLGRIAVADGERVCINQSVALLRLDETLVHVEFASHLLQSSMYQRKMVFDAGGTTIKHIYISRLVKMKIAIPTIAEQRSISTAINGELSKSKAITDSIQKEINLLREYRTRLIADVVTGKLDVREFARSLPADIAEEAAELASSELGDDEFSDSDDELADELAGEPA